MSSPSAPSPLSATKFDDHETAETHVDNIHEDLRNNRDVSRIEERRARTREQLQQHTHAHYENVQTATVHDERQTREGQASKRDASSTARIRTSLMRAGEEEEEDDADSVHKHDRRMAPGEEEGS